MKEIIAKIPAWIIAACIVVLTAVLCVSVILGQSSIDLWGMKIQPTASATGHSNVPIGTIVASYLTPEQMREDGGGAWVLADGKDVSTSSAFYKSTGSTSIPDLRGMFLRGVNAGRQDGRQDPAGNERSRGQYQGDSVGRHIHTVVGAYLAHKDKGVPQLVPDINLQNGAWAGSSSPQLRPNEGDETRPRNIAVYYYIHLGG